MHTVTLASKPCVISGKRAIFRSEILPPEIVCHTNILCCRCTVDRPQNVVQICIGFGVGSTVISQSWGSQSLVVKYKQTLCQVSPITYFLSFGFGILEHVTLQNIGDCSAMAQMCVIARQIDQTKSPAHSEFCKNICIASTLYYKTTYRFACPSDPKCN